MQLLRMKREEKLELILLARFLERQTGKRHGIYFSKNAGAAHHWVSVSCPGCAWLLQSDNKWLRDGVIFYSRGWGWRVRAGWRDVVKQIETEPKPRVSKMLDALRCECGGKYEHVDETRPTGDDVEVLDSYQCNECEMSLVGSDTPTARVQADDRLPFDEPDEDEDFFNQETIDDLVDDIPDDEPPHRYARFIDDEDYYDDAA